MTAPTTPSSSSPATPSLDPAERRARTRRNAALQRAAWMSARARNAARHGALIATIGGAAVIATLLVLVLLPREVDRAIRAQLDTIPPVRDTTPIVAMLRDARTRETAAAAAARITRVYAPASPVTQAVSDIAANVDSAVVLRDSLSIELQQRLTRARGAPLVESYRALAESRLLRDDVRVRAIVDSIEQVDREREAFAALGGPDARYAALSARLAALGQRVMRIGEAELAQRRSSQTSSPSASAPPSAPVQEASAAARVDRPGGGAVVGDTTGAATLTAAAPLLATRVTVADSALVAAAAAAIEGVRNLERSLADTRRANAASEARRASIRRISGVAVPPIAMLTAALIVGLALGYASAVLRELRRPTVGDEAEVERLTQARVITHTGSLDAVRDVRTRRRADRLLSPALDPTAEAWQQLHLTLTGLGDVARAVRVVSDQPLLGGTLAINLAAAAARESRATLIVEPPTRAPLLAMLLRQTRPRGVQDVQQGRAELREVITEVPMGRDVAVDVLFAGNSANGGSSVASRSEIGDEVRRVAARYDLALVLGDSSVDVGVVTPDVIVCARLGVTSLEWLGRVTQQTREEKHRIRAVLLWAAETPSI